MKVDKKLVRKVASIARLQLSESEVEKFSRDFKDILSAFLELDKLNTKRIEPTFQPIPLKNIWREDRVKGCLTQKQALANTLHTEKAYFKGPRVI